MNVEVLGDDVVYGASMNTVFRKYPMESELLGAEDWKKSIIRRVMRNMPKKFPKPLHIAEVKKQKTLLGDDVLLGLDLSGISDFGRSVGAFFQSDTGRAVGGAVLTTIAGRMSPTQKAQVARAQEIVGMQPQVFTGSNNPIIMPTQEDSFKKNLPLILGGVGLLAAITLVVLKKR